MSDYQHTQTGTLIRWLVGGAVLSSGLFGIFLVSQNEPGGFAPIAVSSLLMVVLMLFHALTVTVNVNEVVATFGSGLIRFRYLTSEIESVQQVRNQWYYKNQNIKKESVKRSERIKVIEKEIESWKNLLANSEKMVNVNEVVATFGSGLIRFRYLTSEIESVQQVRNQWYYGWGIKMFPGGWLYNVSGLDAVELVLKDGRKRRIGTDEPEALLKAIQSAVAA